MWWSCREECSPPVEQQLLLALLQKGTIDFQFTIIVVFPRTEILHFILYDLIEIFPSFAIDWTTRNCKNSIVSCLRTSLPIHLEPNHNQLDDKSPFKLSSYRQYVLIALISITITLILFFCFPIQIITVRHRYSRSRPFLLRSCPNQPPLGCRSLSTHSLTMGQTTRKICNLPCWPTSFSNPSFTFSSPCEIPYHFLPLL